MNFDPNNPNNPGYPYQPMPGQMQQTQQQYPAQGQPGMPMPGYTQPIVQQPTPNIVQPTTLPQTHAVNEEMIQGEYAKHKNNMGGVGDKPQYLHWPGPQGQRRWDNSVPTGHKASLVVYIATPWAEGSNIFHSSRTHFWKSISKPQGTSIACPGANTCLICKARETALSNVDDAVRERAKDLGRVRNRFLYNVFVLDAPQSHYDSNGIMRPFILQAGAGLHSSIGDLIEDSGAIKLVDTQQGRPVKLIKKKVGIREMDVEYSLLPLDARPLPLEFYPGLDNLWPLSDLDKLPTQLDMANAVNDMGFPQPFSGEVTNNSLPQPQPAYPSPYPQQAPINVQTQVSVPQQNPTELQPPAVQSTGVPTGYSPQPSQVPMQGMVQPQQTVSTGVQATPMVNTQYPIGYTPPPPDMSAPPTVSQVQGRSDGRDICFGKFDANSNMCVECPPDMQPRCIVQTGQSVAQPQQTIEQVQAKLQGKA